MAQSQRPGAQQQTSGSTPSSELLEEIRAEIKAWVRKEIQLAQSGVSHEERAELNP
jgi:hypothetical protein